MVARKTKEIAVSVVKKNKLAYYVAHKVKNVSKAQLQNLRKLKDIKQYRELALVQKKYNRKNFPINKVVRRENVVTAVVIHLYYIEQWSLFKTSLSRLDKDSFDLFITLPEQHINFSTEIKKSYPHVHIFRVPNRGRDVLPFMRVLPVLKNLGYEYLLKLHSKKSTHRVDGNEWLSDMVGKLLPGNQKVLKALLTTLEEDQTAIIGPEGHYVSLLVNFKSNQAGIEHVLSKIFSARQAKKIVSQSKKYGFFAGTMFWARLDALDVIVAQNLPISKFEAEHGQIDATLAHVLERMFSIVPEIEARKMYAISASGIRTVDYSSGEIPDWSDVYIGPQPNK